MLMRPLANLDVCTCPTGYESEAISYSCKKLYHHKVSRTIFCALQASGIIPYTRIPWGGMARH